MEPEVHIVGDGVDSSTAESSIPTVSCSLPSAHPRPFASRGQIEKEKGDKWPVHEVDNG